MRPSVLYHASPSKNIEILEPKAEGFRDVKEGPVVFATPDKSYASCFLVDTNDSWTQISHWGRENAPWNIIISDEGKFRRLDVGGAIYELPVSSFYCDMDKGTGKSEWVSKTSVIPFRKETYGSGLKAMLKNNVNVFFVSKETFNEIRNSNDHGYAIIKTLQPYSSGQKKDFRLMAGWIHKIFSIRKTAQNIGWKSDEPTEMVVAHFKDGLIKPGDKVLDVGSGFGRNANWLASKGAVVTAVNINDDEIKESRKKAEEMGIKVNYLHGNAEKLSFPNNSFDVLIDGGCTHMISSREGQKKAELEAARVLKPNGILIYFGFSKKHPSHKDNPDSPKFRDLNDIKNIYGEDFIILSSKIHRWKPKQEEHTKCSEHVGLEVVLKKASRG